MELEVTVMSGAGNIFSVIDNRKYNLSVDFYSKFANQICGKSFNEKSTEGLLVLEEKKSQAEVDVIVRFFNPDGSYGMMCGNGGRCAVLFALNNGFINNTKDIISLEVWDGKYTAEIISDKIKVEFPPPNKIILNIPFSIGNKSFSGDYVDVGSPHLLIDFAHLKGDTDTGFYDFALKEFALSIRNNEAFKPNGVNVSIYTLDSDKILLRTYEKGVENETGACGTGAISVAVVNYLKNKEKSSYIVVPPSREELLVEIDTSFQGSISKISLIGNAKTIIINKIILDI